MKRTSRKSSNEITSYDQTDTTNMIDPQTPLTLTDLGLTLPKEPPTKLISIRIPTPLYQQIRAFSTNLDMPYQAYMKYLLAEGLQQEHSKFSKG